MTLEDRLAPAIDAGGTAAALARSVLERADRIRSLSERILALAETAFEEHDSARALADALGEADFRVERGAGGLETAFVAERGDGDALIVFCAEYDALPGIGHACGHHLIAGASVSAAIALGTIADELGATVRVVGTPAEEHGAGKVPLLEAGVFDGARAAVMMHPISQEIRMDPVGTSSQAVGRFRAEFRGTAAHAAAAPHRGVNAADAATVAQVAIGLLRQQLPDDHRVAAFVSHGGEVTNIIPDCVSLDYEYRAFTMDAFDALRRRVEACVQAGALAAGATVEIVATEPTYEPLEQNAALASAWREGMELVGCDLDAGVPLGGGSTDMGNVSRRVPSLHPWVPLTGVTSPIHTTDFAVGAAADNAFEHMHLAAFGLAFTGARAASLPPQR